MECVVGSCSPHRAATSTAQGACGGGLATAGAAAAGGAAGGLGSAPVAITSVEVFWSCDAHLFHSGREMES